MAKADHTNYNLTRPRIFFRVPQRDAMFQEIFGSEPPAKLREFSRAYLMPGTREYKKLEAATNEEDRRHLSALILLARALSIAPGPRTARDLQAMTCLLIPDYPAPRSVFSSGDAQKNAWLYTRLLNAEIYKAHLAVISTKRGESPLPSIVCPDIRTAAFVWTCYRGVEVCPACKRLFSPNPERASQKFCSTNCGQRVYQRRFRRRQKSKVKSRRKG